MSLGAGLVLATGAPGWVLGDPGRWSSVAESRSERLELDEALEEVESGEPGMMGMSGCGWRELLTLLLGAEVARVSRFSSITPNPCCSSTV